MFYACSGLNISIANPAQLNCNTSSIVLNGNSSTPGIVYQWTNGPATANYTVSAAGVYTLTVTDPSNNCSINANVTVTANLVLPNISIAPPVQLNCTNTSVNLNGNSTTAGVIYQWTNGPAASGYTVNTAGIYMLTVTNPINGCSATSSITVNSNVTLPDISIANPAELNCTTTSVTLTGSSMTAGINYQWIGGPTAANYSVSAPGTYSLIVTNPLNGCSSTASITVNSNTTPPSLSIGTPGLLTCNNTSVTLNGNSTTPGVIYQWTNGPSNPSYTVGAAGTYTLSVTDPSNGCTNTATVIVNSGNAVPNISIALPALLDCINTSVTLNGSSTTNGVTYQWTNGPATANYAVSTPGVYTLTVTNPANGCSSTANITVNANGAIPDISITTPLQLNCINISVLLNGNSTTPGVTYQWTNGPSTDDYTVTTAGTYTLTVTDPSNGCTAVANVTVTSNITIPDVSIAPPGQLGCTSSSVTLQGSSTTPGVSFQWVNGPASANYTVSTPGTYVLTVIDPSNGCPATANVTVNSNGTLPDISIVPPTQLNCINTSIVLNGNSTTPGVTYQWINGPATTNYSVNTAGIYTFTVTDPSNGCVSSASVTVVSNTASPNISIVNPAQLTCINSSVLLNGNSITNGATYQWTNGPATDNYTVTTTGNYTLTVTNPVSGCTSTASVAVVSNIVIPTVTIATPAQLGCSTPTITLNASSTTSGVIYQWTNGPATANYTVGAAGTYSLTVLNPTNGCSATASTTVISNGALPDISIAPPTQLSCTVTSIVLNGNSTTPGVTYQWVNGPSSANYTVGSVGTYTLTVIDPSNGCSATANIAVTANSSLPNVSITPPPQLSCTNTSVILSGNSSTANAVYQWTNGPATPNYTVVAAGTYTLTVTDPSNGCSAFTSVTVNSSGVLPDISIATPPLLSCTNAIVNLSGSSITPGVTYQWINGPSSATYAVGSPGTYTLTVIDPTNGCVNTASVIVNGNTVVPSVSIAQPSLLSCTASSVVLDGSSTNQGVLFSWSTLNGGFSGSTSLDDANATSAGTYTLTVTDAITGCFASASVTVSGVAPLISSSQVNPVLCYGDASGSAVINASFGTPGYNWTFSPLTAVTINPSTDSATLTGLAAGTYTYTIVDNGGCVLVQTFTITQPTAGLSLLLTPSPDNCNQNAGSILATAAGGTGTLNYNWQPNVSSTNNAIGLGGGTYTLTITDSFGCFLTQSATVNAPPQLTLSATSSPQVVCVGKPIQLNALTSGGTPNYTITWQPGNLSGATQLLTPTATTTYSVSVTDNNGCLISTTVLATVNSLPVTAFTTDVTQGCTPLCVNFTAQSTNSQLVWDFGDGNTANGNILNYCYTQAGSYSPQLTVTDPSTGCSDSLILNNYITAFPLPSADFSYNPKQSTILNPQVFFIDNSFAGQNTTITNWQWSLGDLTGSTSTEQNPSFIYSDTGCYEIVLIVTDNNGCQATAMDTICIAPDAILYIPNAFTPNGDGDNEVFLPKGIGIDPNNYSLRIYNRWGNLIFYSEDITEGWDGRANGGSSLAQIDTYVWNISCKDVLGKQYNKTGKVSLIR